MLSSAAIVCISNNYKLHVGGRVEAYIPPSAMSLQRRAHTRRISESMLRHQTKLFSTSTSTPTINGQAPAITTITSHDNRHYSAHQSTSLFNVGYDADAIMSYYDVRPWEVGLRLNMLGLPLLGWYLGLVTDKILKIDEKENVERKRGVELREHFVRSKSVALIKSGQALSLRSDLLKSKIWAEELGKLVDEVGSFPDLEAMNIMRDELSDILPAVKNARLKQEEQLTKKQKTRQKWSSARSGRRNKLTRLVENDPILSMFEFYNDVRTVASASIGQVVSCYN